MSKKIILGLLALSTLASFAVFGSSAGIVQTIFKPISAPVFPSYFDVTHVRSEDLNKIIRDSGHSRLSSDLTEHRKEYQLSNRKIPEGMIWHIVFDFTRKIEEKGKEANRNGERGSLYNDYYTRQGPLSVEHDLILKQQASEYFAEIGPIEKSAEKTVKEYRTKMDEHLMNDLKNLQSKRDREALRFRDKIKEYFGEPSFTEFETFFKSDISMLEVRHDMTQPAAPGPFFFIGRSLVIFDETQAPTLIAGFSELYFFYYDAPYFWDPYLESFFLNYTTQQVLHTGFDYGLEDIFPAKFFHPVFVSSVGQTYCTVTDHFAYFWPNLLSPQGWRYTFLGTSDVCHTVNPPPTPTPTPTPTPSPTPCPGLDICTDYTAQIETVGFGGDFPIKRFATQTDITDPTWRRGDAGNSRNYVAYKKDAEPNSMNLSATLRVTPMPTGSLNARVRIKYAGNEVAGPTGEIPVSGDIINISSLPFTTRLEGTPKVKKGDYDLVWEVSFNNGQTWEPSGSSQHPVNLPVLLPV